MHADLGTHSAHCTADRGDLTVTVLGMVVDAPVAVQRHSGWVVQKTVEPPQWQFWVRPVLGQGCCARWCNDWGPRNAWFDYGSMLCIFLGGFLEEFHDFLRDWVSRLLRSILWPARRRQGSGMRFLLVLLVLMHLALCFRQLPAAFAALVVDYGRCAPTIAGSLFDASVALELHLEICTLFLRVSWVFQLDLSSNFCAS